MNAHAGTRNLTVSLVTSVLAERDAISNVCRWYLDTLSRYGHEQGLRTDVKLFTQHSEVADSRIAVVTSPEQLAGDEHFACSDVILYLYGIHYPLFDSIHLAPRRARVAACYFGITPPRFAAPHQQGVLQESYRQAYNLHAADRILVTSRYLLGELADLGVPAARATVVPLPAGFGRPRHAWSRRPADGALRLAYVGRFVPAKGVSDLLSAFHVFRRKHGSSARLDLIGSRTYSDPDYLARLTAFCGEHALDDCVRFHFDVPQAELIDHLLGADALVVPSFHEGFCLPVVEAYNLGCRVIASDAGALPETSGGLGRTFASGNIGELSERLSELDADRRDAVVSCESGCLTLDQWHARVDRHVARFTRECCAQQLCACLFADLDPSPVEIHRYLAFARQQVVGRLAEGHARQTSICTVDRRVRRLVADLTPRPQGGSADETSIEKEATLPAANVAAPQTLRRRLRQFARSIPVVRKSYQYVKRWIYLPWNFHKLYCAHLEALQNQAATRQWLLEEPTRLVDELRAVAKRFRDEARRSNALGLSARTGDGPLGDLAQEARDLASCLEQFADHQPSGEGAEKGRGKRVRTIY